MQKDRYPGREGVRRVRGIPRQCRRGETRRARPGAGLQARHPAVRRERDLLQLFIHRAPFYPDALREACPVYRARWPAWERIRDAQGHPTQEWTSPVFTCPDLPPPPER